MAKFEPAGTFPLRTTTLDHVLFERRANERLWGEVLKIDTQATEYEILRGAERTLRERTIAVIAEVWFCPVYEGQKLFSDVESLLRGHGFSFYGFNSMFLRSRKQLDKRIETGRERALYADAVFFRDPLDDPARLAGLPAPRAQHLLFVTALLTGYHDFALELALNTWARGDRQEAERITHVVRSCAALSPAESREAAVALAKRVTANLDAANIEVGRFVDERRARCDYSDVPLSSPSSTPRE
jgi:hypothetical protein